ncbi:Dynamin [Penicillium chermesinum]|uniref:Dynamin n=1 Tax=Penicillium chermesinum TaxID=63820 RepID=A0A9W9TF99_9EURO|nr:Dynamin [Penicillium chermesinum]KAJ5220536.1 Dynamin [Penicillium chermesinum]
MAVSLLPSPPRSPEDREQFAAFRREFQQFIDLPGIIQDGSCLTGRCGFSEFVDAPTFAADVLHLGAVGNAGLHGTLVNLPGLRPVLEDDGDVKMAQSLVDSYLESSRSIILAAIPASSNTETQHIIQRAHHFDKDSMRTTGIITTLDLINKGTEQRVAYLAKNFGAYQVEPQLLFCVPISAKGNIYIVAITTLRSGLRSLFAKGIGRI